jgi:hypothetical protein
MALVADTPADRAEQLALATERLTALIAEETRLIDARLPLAEGAEAGEKTRLANAYRLELARIQQEPDLLKGAPAPLLSRLRQGTVRLHEALAQHEVALSAVRIVTEGLVQAMAEEVVRQRSGSANYSADGALEKKPGPRPAIVDRNA